FQQMINDLARRYEAPGFEPHATVHVGADQADAAEKALGEVARECKLLGLTPLGIDQSDEFIKTLFVEFAVSAEVRQINDFIREAANDSSQYELKPHLSLLYRNLVCRLLLEKKNSTKIPLSEVTFDAMKTVRCVSTTKSVADVK